MADLDRMVTETLARTLLTPERMREMLGSLSRRQTARDHERSARLDALRKGREEAEAALGRLYDLVEKGLADLTDSTLKERIAIARHKRDIANADFDRASAELAPDARVDDEKTARFTELMRANLTEGTVQFRRTYLRSVLDAVVVDDAEIRIVGRKSGAFRRADRYTFKG